MKMKNKKFLITIDTEGDNLWDWKPGKEIRTKNVQYLSSFQNLCEEYGFKPVWLSNYEMLNDPLYVDFICSRVEKGCAELGMHLHAWNTPPEYDLKGDAKGASYLIEYPKDVMEAKVATMTELIKERCGINPVSHRAGRWAMNDTYFDILTKYGYKADTSVTPGVDWSNHPGQSQGSKGSDYSKAACKPYSYRGILEVPVTIRKVHSLFAPRKDGLRGRLGQMKRMIKGENLWIRPSLCSEEKIMHLLDIMDKDDSDYLMFMMHSSEFMPGGSPYFPSEQSIEALYAGLKRLFERVKNLEGFTLDEYTQQFGK